MYTCNIFFIFIFFVTSKLSFFFHTKNPCYISRDHFLFQTPELRVHFQTPLQPPRKGNLNVLEIYDPKVCGNGKSNTSSCSRCRFSAAGVYFKPSLDLFRSLGAVTLTEPKKKKKSQCWAAFTVQSRQRLALMAVCLHSHNGIICVMTGSVVAGL